MADNILNHPQFDQIAAALEADRGLPAGTLRAVANQESGGNPNAVSNKGAQGAFQFIPSTAKAYNVDVTNPWDSMRGAADYLGDNMKKYGRIDAALADYNGGPSQAQAVLQTGSPTYKETKGYVTSILGQLLNAAIPSANAAEADTQTPSATAQNSPTANDQGSGVGIDPKLQLKAAYKVTQAKIGGVIDDDIVKGLVATAPQPIADAVLRNLQNGVSSSDIVTGIGAQPLAQWQKDKAAANPTNGMSAFDRGIAGMGKAFADMGTGAKQLWTRVTGTPDEIKQLQEQVAEQNRLDAPLMDTTAGKVGYVAGVAAPSLATMGSGAVLNAATRAPQIANAVNAVNTVATKVPLLARSLNAAEAVLTPKTVPQMMGSGAVQGAFTPTATDEEGQNAVGLGALVGGTIGGGGKLLTKAVASPLGQTVANGANALIQKAEQYGLPLSAANIVEATNPTSFVGKFARRMSNPTVEQIQNLDQSIARNVGEGIGVPNATAIDSDMLNASKPYAAFDAATQGTKIPLSAADLQQNLASALAKYGQNTLKPNQAVLDEVQGLINKGAPVAPATPSWHPVPQVNPSYTPQTMQAWASDLGKSLSPDSVSPAAKQLLGATREQILNKMQGALTPEQQAAFDLANQQWANKQAVQKMITNSNNLGHVTPQQMVQAAKNGGLAGDFAQGQAPYQDLAEALTKLYGAKGLATKNRNAYITLADLLTTGAGYSALGPQGLGLALAKKLGEGVSRRALDSQSAAVRNVLVGNTATQQAIGNAGQAINPLAAVLAARLAARQN